MIVAKGLTKRFGDVLAVDNLDMDIRPGEIFGLLGPNGAGKTTTIRMLGALIAPTSGVASIAGYELGRDDNEIRRSVVILTESPGLYDRLSAERNLSFFAELYDVEDIAGQVERYLRLLGLWDRRGDEAATFSKGMRQKLAIARAMLHEPEVLFLDEPTAGLDPEMSRLVRKFIGELKGKGRTIFLCTHNLDEADRLCDRIAVLNGRLLAIDTPEALRNKLYDRKVVFHLGSVVPAYEALVSEQPFVHVVETRENKLVIALDDPEINNPKLIRELVEAGADIQFVGELRHSLEDIYLRLVE